MRHSWTVVLCISWAVLILAGGLQVRGAENNEGQITCTGKVVDEQGRPVSDAKIELYRVAVDSASLSYELELAQEGATKEDGLFTIKSTVSDDELLNQVIILADKEGLALGWANWRLQENLNVEIVLRAPKVLAGIVVDEEGSPIGDADIGISYMLLQAGGQQQFLVGDMKLDHLTTRSNADGTFSFGRIPAEASAEFIVKKTGRATVSTFNPQNYQGRALQFISGQTDIRITQPIGAKIEGVVVQKADGKPVGGVRMMVMRGGNLPTFGLEPIVSKEDGTFSISGLTPGEHLLRIVTQPGETADWITEPVEIHTDVGKTTSGVKVEVIKGGVLEVLITDSFSKRPVDKATVSIQPEDGGMGTASRTDIAGIARTRLMPGEYRITYLYKQGYSRQRLQEEIITIEDGKTVRIEHQLAGLPRMTGVVRDDQGRPADGVRLKICPMSGQESVSDAEGKFEVSYDPGRWSSSRTPLMILLARHLERNMAAAVEVDENTQQIDVALKPGVTFTGKVVDPDGEGIANASLLVMLRGERWSSSIEYNIPTDAEGNFQIKALAPEHKYTVQASANGYGRCQIEADAGQAADNHLNVEPLTLLVANLSVSGVVVDSDDQPVPGANVSCYDENQPRCTTQTNAEGEFTLEKVCEGKIRISANKSGATQMYGSIETEGGATDVRIAISQRSTSTRYEPKRPPSLVGKSLPDLKALGINLSPGDIDGKRVLVCFWDMQQRPSRHCMTQLAKQAELLKDKGVVVVAVQASKIEQSILDEWVKKSNAPFWVGKVSDDGEKTRFAWGVRSLPWLILTDNNHVVVSQGFGLGDLNNQIGQSRP